MPTGPARQHRLKHGIAYKSSSLPTTTARTATGYQAHRQDAQAVMSSFIFSAQ